MTVYADILVLVNLYIDFFLLWAVKKFLGLRAGNGRLALGALAGGFCSLTALLPGSSAPLSLLLGLCTALLTTAAAFCPTSPRGFFRAALYFWAFTLLLAGFFLFLLRFFAPGNVAVLGNVVYFDLSPALLFLFTCTAYLVLVLLRRLFPGRDQSLRCCWITLENRSCARRLYARADTGNALREPFSGLPVIVCREKSLGGCIPPEIREYLETGSCTSNGGLRLIPFETVGGAGVLPAFRPERLRTAEGQSLECYIAVCTWQFSAGQIDALYNPDLFPEAPASPKPFFRRSP